MTILRRAPDALQIWPPALYLAGSIIVMASSLLAAGSWQPLILLLHLVSFCGVWLLTIRLEQKRQGYSSSVAHGQSLAHGALVLIAMLTALVIALYPLALHRIPLIASLASNDHDAISALRNQAFQNQTLLSFVVRMLIHGVAPLMLVYLWERGPRKVFWLVAMLVVGGASMLMFKSMVAILLAPLALFALLRRQILLFGAVIVAFAAVMVVQVVASNPHLRGYVTIGFNTVISMEAVAQVVPQQMQKESASKQVSLENAGKNFIVSGQGVIERALLKSGEGVAFWLKTIPRAVPYSRGCSVRIIARTLGCEHINMPRQMYQLAHPDYVARGLIGSLDVPHYVQDYAMFGRPGLVASGMLAALALFAMRLLAPGISPAYFLPVLLASFITGVPEIILSEGGLLGMIVMILISRAQRIDESSPVAADQFKDG